MVSQTERRRVPHPRIVANERFLANPRGLNGSGVNPQREIDQMHSSMGPSSIVRPYGFGHPYRRF